VFPPEEEVPEEVEAGVVAGVVGGTVGVVAGLVAVPEELPEEEEEGVVGGTVFPPEDEDELPLDEEEDPLVEEGLYDPHKVVLATGPLLWPGRGGFKQGSLVQMCKASVLKYLHLSLPGLAKSPPLNTGSSRAPLAPPLTWKSTQL
jgi:hypothetical protein